MQKKLVVGIILGICILSLVIALAVEPGEKPLISGPKYDNAIGLISIEGPITGGDVGGLFEVSAGAESIMEQLREAAKDKSLKAVIIRINSPGGTVAASQEIGEEVEKVRKAGKKVVISMGDVAASGGYWIAAKGDKIVANPGTVTGSIGVIMESLNMSDLYNKVGIADQSIKSGAHKDMGSPSRPLTQEEKVILQSMVDDMFNQFVDVVAKGRRMKREDVLKIADGRVFTGRQAKSLGLVDELGNYYDAVRLTAKLAGIKGEPEVVELKPKDPWASFFGKAMLSFGIRDYEGILKAAETRDLPRYMLLWPDLLRR
ncbi:signal peptide peptidase SppA [Thermincola potens]|uniref:Signal peptide peptidase SppA, 36K type n=1 Tax=Thermincola potens (strain JR) TaxID=635013 RepID=D5XDK7_THEPJ|nr:signal peptide peptidase SppA [Thermincola potens]ADG83753.1 signal peptide peptidase SppA, 36K type [Thermincola potens JR]